MSSSIRMKTCACGRSFPDIFGSDRCTACVFTSENPSRPETPPPPPRGPATAMLMMDGKLLTINMLMSVLRYMAIEQLALEAPDAESPEEDTRIAMEIHGLIQKMAVRGLRELIATKAILGWEEIVTFSQAVVDEVNK